MPGYISSIRSIEQTTQYSPIQPVSRYTAYPYRKGESKLLPHYNSSWVHYYQEAADSVAEWLKLVKTAQAELDQLILNVGRLSAEPDSRIADEVINRINLLLNKLRLQYEQHASTLKPELWAAIELAMQHPAVGKLELSSSLSHKYADSEVMLETMKLDEGKNDEMRDRSIHDQQMKQLLLGADGFLNDLKRALAYGEQQHAIDLLQLPFAVAYPYALYYGAMQTYWPLPAKGIIMNKYL